MLVENLERVLRTCVDVELKAKRIKVVYPTSNKEKYINVLVIDIHHDGTARPELQNFVEIVRYTQRLFKN